MTVRVQQDQTIYDLANKYYGSVEGVFQIIEDNPELDLNVPLQLGYPVNINEGVAVNPEVKEYMSRNNVEPNNANSEAPLISGFSSGFKKQSFR